MNAGIIAVLLAATSASHDVTPSGNAAPDPGAYVADVGPDAAGPPAGGTSGPPGRLTIRGRVTDGAGNAIPAVRIFLEGARREIAVPDRHGRFALEVPISPVDSLIRAPLALWLNARRTGWRIGLASGAPRLRIELRAVDDSLGARRLRVRTNDPGATASLVRALADGIAADTIEVAFTGAPGKDPEPRDVALDATGDIVVTRGRVTSYAIPDSTEPAARPVAPPAADAGTTSRTPVGRRPSRPANSKPPAPAPVVAAPPRRAATSPSDSCLCRIEGTLEVRWDHPLPERVPVALWLEDAPTVRDSVELLLGSPRAFVLPAAGCGPHRVRYLAYSRLKFNRLTSDPVIECTDQGHRQLRIVLEPVRTRPPR